MLGLTSNPSNPRATCKSNMRESQEQEWNSISNPRATGVNAGS
jgi:hypothetical protein